MKQRTQAAPGSRAMRWTGQIFTWLPGLFMLMDGTFKLIKPAQVVEATVRLGYPESIIIPLGVLLLCCTAIFLIPRTAMFGAILLTGYLGGVVATHVRAGSNLFSIVFPILLGMLVWGGLYLRDARLRELVPLTR